MKRPATERRRPSPALFKNRQRTRLLLTGLAVIAGLSLLLTLLWLGRGLPGWPGEVFRMITGLLSTPIFMELSFLFAGLLIVLGLNYWRRRRDGDEYVYLDQVVGHPEVPPHARFAIHDGDPVSTAGPDPLLRAEGSLEIGDHQAAAEALAELDPASLRSPQALALRIRLAETTGQADLARRLRQR